MWNLGGAVNSAAASISRAPVIGGAVSNPLFMALFLTALVVVLLMATYYQAVKSGGWRKWMRIAVAVFIVLAILLFLHHHVVTQKIEAGTAMGGRREVFDGIEASRHGIGGGGHPVRPSYYGDDGDGDSDEDFSDVLADAGVLPPSGGGRPDNIAAPPRTDYSREPIRLPGGIIRPRPGSAYDGGGSRHGRSSHGGHRRHGR